MKKLLAILICVFLLGGAALAESPARFDFDNPTTLDLNGDGEIEQAWLQMVGAEEERTLMLVVVGADQGVNTFTTGIRHDAQGGALDLNGDGRMEIYLTGDQFSNDYVTYCLIYTKSGLKPVPFPHFNRSGVFEDTSDFGYGRILGGGNGQITLAGTQDVLGTWEASRTLELRDTGFAFADNGLFVVNNDEDAWEYRCLTLTKPISVVFTDGETDAAGTLDAGASFIIEKTDLTSIVYFRTKNDRTGFFEIAPDTARGWGSMIEGQPEGDFFEYIPYAD